MTRSRAHRHCDNSLRQLFCVFALYTHRSFGERSDENRRITAHLQSEKSVLTPGDRDSPPETLRMCVSCSQVCDGRPVCEKCFSVFLRTTDMTREMYKRYGTFVCDRIVPRCPTCVKPSHDLTVHTMFHSSHDGRTHQVGM